MGQRRIDAVDKEGDGDGEKTVEERDLWLGCKGAETVCCPPP
jgi:hypothetical protein